jgi:NAD(P)-dependent dehydrogenase (short-subunit alcohol dehydrogenase family)
VSTLTDHYRTAFVTGASTGLGRAFAEMLLADGLEVWGTSRRPDRLPPRERFHAVALDLADGPAAERSFREAEQAAGGFDIVINNAGYSVFGAFADTDFDLWQRQLEAMLVNTARLARAALRGMRVRGRGALVNVSSMAVEFPLPFQSAYNMAKAGLSALSESLMTEIAGTGVVVIDLRPGDFRTDFDGSVQRAPATFTPRMARVWGAFARMMETGPAPARAAAVLRRALLARRSGTVRPGRLFQTWLAPLLARFGPRSWSRYFQERYFGAAP